jgi:hypothetical protein
LLGLAKACLAPAPGARPADAAEVAGRVNRYRDEVAARQAQAERGSWLRQAAERAGQAAWEGGEAFPPAAEVAPARLRQQERLAVEVGTARGWSDFCRWAVSTPGKFALLHTLAGKGTCANPRALYHEIHAAAKVKPPGPSAKAVANRLLAATTDEGTFSVSQEPEDTELD